jgi:hypothetical protein
MSGERRCDGGVPGDTVFGGGSVDGFAFGAGVGFNVDGGVDGDGGVDAEDWIEPEGYAGSEDGGPAIAGVVLRSGAERGIEARGEGDDALGPASFVVAEAVLLPTISLTEPVVMACA